MVYLKYFEFGPKIIMLVPKRGRYSVKIRGYKSPRYKGPNIQNFCDYQYEVFKGTLAECNDVFNLEVTYCTRIYDEDIYIFDKYISEKENISF